MRVSRLKIENFRGVKEAELYLRTHSAHRREQRRKEYSV